MERKLAQKIWERFKRLRYLAYAVVVLFLVPCVIEFSLRLAACRSEIAGKDATPEIQLVPSWTTFHQLKPMQQLQLADSDDPSAFEPATLDANVSTDNDVAQDEHKPIEFRTNSFGFRGDEIDVPKQPGVLRIIVAGDELTLAPHLAEQDSFCQWLQSQLQSRSQLKVEVINASTPDFCPLLSYLQVRHSLLNLQPDIVILQLSPNDTIDDGLKRRQTELGPGEIPLACIHPKLIATPKTRPLSEHFLTWKLAENSLAGWLTERPTHSNNDRALVEASIGSPATRRVPRQAVDMMLDPVKLMREALSVYKCQLLVALPPLTADAWMALEEDHSLIVGEDGEVPDRSESRTVLERIKEFAVANRIVLCNSTIKQPSNDQRSYRSSKMTVGQHRFHAQRLTDSITALLSGPWLRKSSVGE